MAPVLTYLLVKAGLGGNQFGAFLAENVNYILLTMLASVIIVVVSKKTMRPTKFKISLLTLLGIITYSLLYDFLLPY
jgi:hypothetical protein